VYSVVCAISASEVLATITIHACIRFYQPTPQFLQGQQSSKPANQALQAVQRTDLLRNALLVPVVSTWPAQPHTPVFKHFIPRPLLKTMASSNNQHGFGVQQDSVVTGCLQIQLIKFPVDFQEKF